MLKCRLSIKKIILSLTVSNSRNSSAELKLVELGVGLPWNPWVDPLRVVSVTAHHNCLAVAYRHFVAIYKLKVLFSCIEKLDIVLASFFVLFETFSQEIYLFFKKSFIFSKALKESTNKIYTPVF